MTTKFEVTEYWAMHALFSMLKSAKFSRHTRDIYQESPYIAKIMFDLHDALLETEKSMSKKLYDGRTRHILPDSELWKECVDYACGENWHKHSFETKQEIARNIHSPFVIKGEMLDKFIADVDALHQERPKLDYQIHIVYSDYSNKYIAYMPELDDCFAKGDSPEEALANLKPAKEKCIEQAKRENRRVDPPYFSPSWIKHRFEEND